MYKFSKFLHEILKKNYLDDEFEILLLDCTMDFNEIETIIHEKNPKIITFDYESHNLLDKKNITHELSETFLTKNDLNDIQEKSYKFSLWFEKSEISHFFEYNEINLGELFYTDFHFELVPILKRIYETKKILKQYENSFFHAPNQLFQIINLFTNKTNNLKSNFEEPIIFENAIKIPIKLGNHVFSIKLKYKYLKNLNNFLESLFYYFNFGKNKFQKSNNTTLLIDFTTKRYRQIFETLPNSSLNLIKFDRIVPSMWNLESFSIIKKSNCVIENYKSLINKKLKNDIKVKILEFEKHIKLIWNEKFFETFFSLDQISFWKIIKPILVKQFKQKYPEAIQEIEITKKLFSKYTFKTILVWSETMINHLIAIKLAKKFSIPIFLIQHGMYYDNNAGIGLNKFGRIIPYYSDKFLVWGDILKKYAVSLGFSEKRIEVVGSPIHDDVYLSTDKSEFSDDFILLATSSPSQNVVTEFTVEIFQKYTASIKKICKTTTQIGKKLVIKQHPQAYELDIDKIVHDINPDIEIIKAGEITPLIKSCEIFITLDLSTTILEAQIFQKPVMSFQIRDHTQFTELIKSNSCLSVTIENFEHHLNQILVDKKFKNELIEKGTNFSKKYLENLGCSSQKLLNLLTNLKNPQSQ